MYNFTQYASYLLFMMCDICHTLVIQYTYYILVLYYILYYAIYYTLFYNIHAKYTYIWPI